MIKKLMLMGLLGMMLCVTANASAEDVYATKNGEKYHKVDCILIKNKDAVKVTKEEALENGLTPCKRCFKEDIQEGKSEK